MRSLRRDLIPFDWCPYEMGKFANGHAQKKDNVQRYRKRISNYKLRREA